MRAIHTAIQKRRPGALIGLPVLFLAAYLIKNPGYAAQAALSGLRLFGLRLFPALFPMAVIAAFFSSQGQIPLVPVGFFAKFLKISRKCAAALIFGLFAGFPIGAMAIGNLYKQGRIEKEQAESLLGIVSNPGIAFLIGGVGAGLFGDARIGAVIFLAQTAAVLLMAILRRGGRNGETVEPDEEAASLPLTDLFCQSVAAATVGMLNVCGYVVFFSVVSDFVGRVLADLPALSGFAPVVSGFLEIGGGMQAASAIGGIRGFLMAAAFAGWSGLSVHLQIASSAPGLRMGRAILDRAILTVVLPLIAYAILRLSGLTIP